MILCRGKVGVAETGGEHCSPAKNHKVTFLIVFFSLVRKERKGQKEESIPLLNSFCRLAATGANTLPRQSRYSLTTATGSKRSSADSDLLLCHVRLWRTSRFKFGCVSVCEHSKIRVILAIQNIVTPHPSRFARHLLPQSRRRRPRLLRKSVNSPLEKAGKTPNYFQSKNVHCICNTK